MYYHYYRYFPSDTYLHVPITYLHVATHQLHVILPIYYLPTRESAELLRLILHLHCVSHASQQLLGEGLLQPLRTQCAQSVAQDVGHCTAREEWF